MANLRLKHDDQGEHQVREHIAHNPVQRREFANARQIKSDGNHYETNQHGNGARSPNHHKDLVDQQSDEENVERNPCALRPRRDDWRHSNRSWSD
jgi:hypothetical protein